MRRRRLDEVLVGAGLATDRAAAAELVAAGRVLVAGAVADNPARAVAPADPVRVVEPSRYVSRGGDKLDGALDELGVDVAGRLVLDAGASTGGFTDCVLQRGASRVLAVDVGRSQLHERLRADPRVISLEQTDVRTLAPELVERWLGGLAQAVVADLSFISLARCAGSLVSLSEPRAPMVLLVKPQFEVDRATASRGRGVVREPAAWRGALERCASAVEAAGAGIMGVVASSVAGAAGNVEFFVHAVSGEPGRGDAATRRAIDAAIRRVTP